MLNLDYNQTLKMYISAKPTPPVIELYCWLDHPDGTPRHAEIVDVQGNEITVKLTREDGAFLQYWTQSRANIHKVHRYNAITKQVVQFFGEPRPC